MYQRVVILIVNQCMKNQLKRLKIIISRLEKEFVKKRKHIDSWAKKVSMKLTTSFESHLVFNVNIIWKSSCVQRQHIIVNAKSLWEIWSKKNHDNNNEKHSKMNKRDWCQQDVIDTQEHKDDEKIIKTADISSQDEKQ